MPHNVSPDLLAKVPLVVHRAAASGRPDLVFVRCGRASRHYELFPLPADRSWDLALSFYEEHRPEDLQHADYVLSGCVSKWHAFSHAWFHEPQLGLRRHAYAFLVDDDVRFRSAADIGRMFAAAREHGFDVCQPSLSPQSHAFWDVTRHHPSFAARQTNFVECMTPLFAAQAVEKLREDLCAAVSGCGLDLILQTALGPQARLGVIDAVVVTHDKPVDMVDGAFYKMLRSIGVDHDREIAWFLARHGLSGIDAMTIDGTRLPQRFYPQP